MSEVSKIRRRASLALIAVPLVAAFGALTGVCPGRDVFGSRGWLVAEPDAGEGDALRYARDSGDAGEGDALRYARDSGDAGEGDALRYARDSGDAGEGDALRYARDGGDAGEGDVLREGIA